MYIYIYIYMCVCVYTENNTLKHIEVLNYSHSKPKLATQLVVKCYELVNYVVSVCAVQVLL